MPPRTRYATSGDLSIAYQVLGEGPDLAFCPGFVSHLEWSWEQPRLDRFLNRLASFARLILFDKRGTGLSDPVNGPPTLEERIDDLRAVLDSVGSERTAILGISEGGAMAALFAAAYPSRVSALVLYGAFAKLPRAPDYPQGVPEDLLDRILLSVVDHWGDGRNLAYWGPGGADDPALQDWWGALQRMAASPRMARDLLLSYPAIDVRQVLSAIRVPTLVVHRRQDRQISVRLGRFIAEHVPDARYVELEGEDHLYFLGDADALLDEIEEFLTGVRRGPEPQRVLATVLFIDVVDSTVHAAELGDRRWLALLDTYLGLARKQLDRHRGTEIETTGDGLLATFDGPARAIRCAMAMRDAARSLGLDLRAGLHTGEIELHGTHVGGIGVHIAARVVGDAGPGEILVSSTVKDLVAGSGIGFEDRGLHRLKGVPDEWRLLSVLGPGTDSR